MNSVIVITGSTRGIGLGLARAFLGKGCRIVLSGRHSDSVDRAVASLAEQFGAKRILGVACDVRSYDEVLHLWEQTCEQFGVVDIWINNAGVAHPQMPLHRYPPELLSSVVETNLIGMLNGAHIALRGMLAQGHGSLYNMHGLGSDGRKLDGLALYGATKYGLSYLTESLVKEMKGTPILVGSISPGMVATDLLTAQFKGRPEDWERARRIFNILADKVETVSLWIADKVLENQKHGAHIRWMSNSKMLGRFLMSPFVRRNIVDDLKPMS